MRIPVSGIVSGIIKISPHEADAKFVKNADETIVNDLRLKSGFMRGVYQMKIK